MKVIQDLWDVYDDCKTDGWDNYDAQAVAGETFEISRHFLDKLLGNHIRPPEIAADPDGEISFEWYERDDLVFAISVSPQRKLAYAGILGQEKTHGIEHFGNHIPPIIFKYLRKYFSRLL